MPVEVQKEILLHKTHAHCSSKTNLNQMSIEDYIAAQRNNIASIRQLPHFSILGSFTDKLYERAIALVPISFPPPFGQLLLICHRALLSALTLIGQAQPDDAAPITRRTIEAVRLAIAVKRSPKNATEWAAYEQRMERWKARDRGEKPKPLSPKLDLPRDHPILSELEKQLGILSDSSVHFTPEYFGSQHWIKSEARIELRYFTSDQRIIERELITLVGIHASILRIFDECFDGSFFSDKEWQQMWQQLETNGRPLSEPFKPADTPEEI